MTTGCKKVQNGTQVLGSFFPVNGFGRIFKKKLLFKNNRLIVFSIVCKLVSLKTIEKTTGLLFLNNTLLSK